MHNDLDRRLLLGTAGLAGLAALASAGRAGPLDPPAGGVTGTGKMLNEVEPRRPLPDAQGGLVISASGSYYLTRNLVNESVTVLATGVTLDLCGFCITLNAGTAVLVALDEDPQPRSIVVRNGAVHGGGGVVRGVWASAAASASAVVVEDVRFSGTSGGAVAVEGAAAALVVRRCIITQPAPLTAAKSITGAGPGVVEGCTLNGGGGIALPASGSVVRGCRLEGTVSGIRTGNNGVVEGCSLLGTAFEAVDIGSGSRVERCVIVSCTSAGIYAAASSLVTVADCTIDDVRQGFRAGGRGIRASDRLRVERCRISNCARDGVYCSSFDATIIDTTVVLCGTDGSGAGIRVVGPALIDRCHLANNQAGGIEFDQLTRVSQCHLDFNGAFGVSQTAPSGIGGDIDGCTISRHTTGVSLGGTAGNAVTRCRFIGNTAAVFSGGIGNTVPQVSSATANAGSAFNPLASIVM